MEKLLFALLISLIICQEKIPYNIKNKEGEGLCIDDSFEENGDTEGPAGVSECIDQKLSVPDKINYPNHCCYARYQLRGRMYAKCIALREEKYLDIVEYIRMKESGEKKLGSESRQLKIYDINCFSSYLKIFSATLLLALLF